MTDSYDLLREECDQLKAENKELAERLRLFELILGGRAGEIYHEMRDLRAEVRRLKVEAGEPVMPLPEEFVGPMPDTSSARLRRKIKGMTNAKSAK